MHKQKGLLLIELAVVVAILTLIAAGTVTWMTQRAEKTKVESLAVLMVTVQQGLQSLLDMHAYDLQQADSFTLAGIEDLTQPTVLELKQLGFLAPSFSLHQTLQIALYKEGLCPGELCHVHGVIYVNKPLLNGKSYIDMNAVAQWQTAVKGSGLVVYADTPRQFTGAQLQVMHAQLTQQEFAVGTVALLASTDASIIARGGLSPNKNPNFQTDVDVMGSLNAAEDVSVGRYLILPKTERLGETCFPIGAITRGGDGQGLMSCENERWTRASVGEISPEAYREMIRVFWKITIPDSPGGFFARKTEYYSYHCWIPNPLNRYHDGRGICACADPYSPRSLSKSVAPAVKDSYFEIGIARPALSVYICV